MIHINANDLKDYIIENDLVNNILVNLECHDIKEYSTEWRCGLPDGHNKTAVCIKKESLSITIRDSNGTTHGNIYTLVMTIKNFTFGKANQYLHKLFNIKYEYNKNKQEKEKDDPLQIFKKVKRSKCIVNQDMPIYNEEILKEYIQMIHIDWLREGIMPFTAKRFNIGYSYDRKRIVIPERYWCGDDHDFIGIMGRTTIKEWELLDIPKYYPLKVFSKGKNVYGLNENYKSIQEIGYVTVFESQKSVLKRHSRKDESGVSIGNCELTEEQVKILLGLNVDIILCLDEGIDINKIRMECNKFYPIRNVYYLYDRWGLIQKGSKDSPADKENRIYNYLFSHKVKYDEKERKQYLEWQERQRKNLKH